MKEVVLITVAGGLVAQQLVSRLQQSYSVRFLTCNANKSYEFEWGIKNNKIDPIAFQVVNHIIHLAGALVAKKRWIKSRRNSSKLSR